MFSFAVVDWWFLRLFAGDWWFLSVSTNLQVKSQPETSYVPDDFDDRLLVEQARIGLASCD